MIKKSLIKCLCIDPKPECWLGHQLMMNDKIKAKPVSTRILEYGNTDGIPLVPSYLSNSLFHNRSLDFIYEKIISINQVDTVNLR